MSILYSLGEYRFNQDLFLHGTRTRNKQEGLTPGKLSLPILSIFQKFDVGN